MYIYIYIYVQYVNASRSLEAISSNWAANCNNEARLTLPASWVAPIRSLQGAYVPGTTSVWPHYCGPEKIASTDVNKILRGSRRPHHPRM